MSWHAHIEARQGDFELDVDIEGSAGVLALIGPNGSGKTTVLRALTGALALERAEIVVAGEVLASTSRGVHMAIERRRIGYVPQGCGLFAHLSVLDNVAFGLEMAPEALSRQQRHARARAMLEALGASELAGRGVRGLSGGERQRVALARALVMAPRLLALDEPMAALDVGARRAVRAVLAEHLDACGCPSVVVTHDVRDVVALGATVCVLERGRVLQHGTLERVAAAPGSAFVEEFVALLRPGAGQMD